MDAGGKKEDQTSGAGEDRSRPSVAPGGCGRPAPFIAAAVTDCSRLPSPPATDDGAGSAGTDPRPGGRPDGVEIWFHEYVRRRVSDEFAKPWWAMPGRRAGPLSLFPGAPRGAGGGGGGGVGPAATRTRCGIQVSISPYFLPEMTRHFGDGGAGAELLFAYQCVWPE